MAARQDVAPGTVRLAAICFLLYGIIVLINAALLQQAGGWEAAGDFPRAVIRVLGAALIAWGLWHLARWAWWLGVLLGGFWLVAGLTLIGVMIGRSSSGGLVGFQIPGLVLFAALPLLIAGVGLLLLPQSRAAFRRAS